MITLSGFPDEALTTFRGQLRMLRGLSITHCELRRVGTRGVLQLTDTAADRAAASLDAAGVLVNCLASVIGKESLTIPFVDQVADLHRAAALARRFGTPWVRVFSWYTSDPDADRSEVLRRIGVFANVADAEGIQLLHENDKGTWGATPQRCAELVEASRGRLRLIFDPANFVQCGVHPVSEAWPLLGPSVQTVHVKDADAATGRVRLPGRGHGQLNELVWQLAESGWSGTCAIEPHLGLGGRGVPVTTATWARAARATVLLLDAAGVPWE